MPNNMVRRQKYEPVKNFSDENGIIPRKILTTPCLWNSFRTVLLISTYFIPSIGLTFYQRWLYHEFRFPLFVVTFHLVIKYVLSAFIRTILTYHKGRPRITVNWKDYMVAVLPPGFFSGIDISLSNWGLELVTLSLYTMTKSTTIVFILAFSILLKLERRSWSLSLIVIMISLGLFLFTYEATQFNLLGFILLLIASVSSGIRWSCTQLLLQKSKMGMRNPIDMIYHMQPCMIVAVLPFAILIEGSSLISNCQTFRNADYSRTTLLLIKVSIGAVIAFLMEVMEVMVVSYTSGLTLSIAGIFKEIFMLVLAFIINGDRMSSINALGLLLCLGGIISHVIHKIRTTYVNNLKDPEVFEIEKFEDCQSLMNSTGERCSISTDSDEDYSDTQVLFDILNRRNPTINN